MSSISVLEKKKIEFIRTINSKGETKAFCKRCNQNFYTDNNCDDCKKLTLTHKKGVK